MQRTCSKCGKTHEPPPYLARRGQCVACKVAQNLAYRQRRRAEGRPVGRPAKPLRVPKLSEAERARLRQDFRKRYADPEKRRLHQVRSLTRHAIARGDLLRQPCEVCGAEQVEAHHDDYSRPLEVRWLCPVHHREHHQCERDAARAAA